MSLKVDMHLHSFYSDGSMSPTDLVKRAKDLGYDTIALTDHDTVGGVGEAVTAGKALDLQVVPGIELSADAGAGIDVHILGYAIDIQNVPLRQELAEVFKNRADRNDRLLAVLREMGISIGYEDLDVRPECGYVGKPNIARVLVKKGYIDEPKEAFEPGRFLEAPEAKAVKKKKLPAEQAIRLICGAGGIAVLAHPMRIKGLAQRGSQLFYEKVDHLTAQLKAIGLSGMECFHTDHTHEEALRLVSIAEKYKLHITEGSDYHGPEFEKRS